MTPEKIKQLTPDGYGGDFEMTGQIDDPVLFNGKDIRTVYPISTFSGTTQDELVELIRQVQVRAQVEVQDKVQVEGDMDVTRKTKKRIKEANQ